MFKVGHKECSWEGSTLEDESKTLDSILHPKEGLMEVPLDADLSDKLTKLITGGLSDLSPTFNRQTYETLDKFSNNAKKSVDIILPVYSSIHIVEPCIRSVLSRTNYPFTLIVVDDSSDENTQRVLKSIADQDKRVTIIRNRNNKGFAASVNRGMKVGIGHYICLLNSDVLVTDRWLTKMVVALEADDRNQIVNPATNNTAQIDIPMSPGASYLTMNSILEKYAKRRYPEIMPTGFCFMFRRELIGKIGYFDEAFVNYGEESDWWMRCVNYAENGQFKKYRAIMADDTYLFHERGTSFSALGQSAHMSLRSSAAGRFHAAWPQYGNWAKTFKPAITLGNLRQAVPSREISSLLDNKKYRICWVVRSAEYCGGMKYIADIVNEINERGGDARVALIQRKSDSAVNVLGELRSGVVVFSDETEFLSSFKNKVFSNGYVIAATVELARIVKALCDSNRKLHPVLHAQSYEPLMVDDEAMKEEIKKMFHLIPDVISNSNWITEKLEEDGVKPFATINPGVDTKLFYPRGRETGDDRPTVLMPLISSYPFKGFNRGVSLVKSLWRCAADKGMEIRILLYGVDNIPELKGIATCLGALSPPRLAKVLGTEVDVFIDPAHIHSYGMPAIEAMASGVSVVSWNNLGIREYAKHGKTAIMFNKNEHDAKIAEAAIDLLTDVSKRVSLAQNAYTNVVENHDRNVLVPKFIGIFENKFIPPIIPKKITFVTPHMRKHGGPTTIIDMANKLSEVGHDVSILTIYDDINPEISNRTDLPIFVGAERLRPCDVLITNSDNPYNERFSNYPDAKKKILLKLSHNARFKELEDSSLKMNWDNIVTTTNWLKDCCEKPQEGWTHPAVQATRIGWYHYSHDLFKCTLEEKKFNDDVLTIGMLVHQHPLKGSQNSVDALVKLKSLFNTRIKVIAIGEVPAKQVQLPNWITYMPNLSREDLAGLFKRLDIWISSSHTEGLGRLALENMSSRVACVLSDTQIEFGIDGENCLLFPIGDIEAAANQLIRLVQYPDLKRKISENGFKTAEVCASPKRCIEALNAIVRE